MTVYEYVDNEQNYIGLSAKDERWKKFSICGETDPEAFFPTKEKNYSKFAKKLCQSCPVKEICLEYALINEEHGIWGGTSSKQRRKILKNR